MSSAQHDEYRVTMRVDLPGLPNFLQARLQHLINLVTFGYRAAEQLPGWELTIPGASMILELSKDPEAWNPSTTKSSFLVWLTRSALRDAVESFASYLERVREVCAMWTLATLRDDSTFLGEEWNRYSVEDAKRFHDLGLPARMDHLAKRYGLQPSSANAAYVLAINRARNCLVHRDGIVGTKDLVASSAEIADALQRRRKARPQEKWSLEQLVAALQDASLDTKLSVSWLRFETSVRTTAGELKIWTGEPLEARGGDRIAVKVVESKREFELGSTIRFEPAEFAEICLTLVVAAKDLRQALEAFGRARGIPFQDARSPEGESSDSKGDS